MKPRRKIPFRQQEPILQASFREMNRRFLLEIGNIAGEIEKEVQEQGLREKVRQIRDLARQIAANERAERSR